MRLWHKDLIPVLPRNQLVGQWRECCLIAKALHDGNLNHLLVNKVKEYPNCHFWKYGRLVWREAKKRGYTCAWERFDLWFGELANVPTTEELFFDWHNDRYLRQCYYNLEEKYDCGGISEEEFERIKTVYNPSRDG